MPRYLAEPEHDHGKGSCIGVLLINLGTPEAPTPKALRTYLKQFLSDPRVVEIPRLLWWLILNVVILNTRPSKSAEKYAAVWTSEGSPLRVHTQKQAKLLQGYFVHSGDANVLVEYAMRYGQPDVERALMRLKARGCDRVLALPLYPQFAASTTGSAFDALAEAGKRIRNLPALRFVRNFHNHPDYIDALAQQLVDHWAQNGMPEKLVMSFHGLPRFSLDRGDPYFCECQKTARLLAERLSLTPSQYTVTFQSRFGRTEWLKPYTEPTLRQLAKDGIRTVDVICPGFVADCLETLEEIAMECKAAFLSSGGKAFRYVPCLNERHEFIAALRTIVSEQATDWLNTPKASEAELKTRTTAAKHAGAAT